MTQTPEPNPTGTSRRSPLLRAAVGVVVVSALAALVYGTTQGGGKKSASGESPCAASAALAAKLSPLAHGEVAALNISKSPALAPDLAFDAPDGRRISLSDFRGKTVLLNLWATWCLPCRAEMPALDRLQEKLGGEKFEVVAISIDTARLDRRQAFLKEAGVKSLAFYADPKANVFQVLKQAGKVVGLPTTMLIDARGCELGVMAGPAEWDSQDAEKLILMARGS